MSSDPFAELADRYLGQYENLRGVVRAELVHRRLLAHLPSGELSIVDIGGGDGRQAIRLAREGHTVDLVDPSDDMLHRAEKAIGRADRSVQHRIHLVKATADRAGDSLNGHPYDAVICHGVVMHLEDPAPLIRSLVSLARPGDGIISLLAKNASALALRPALQHRWRDALGVLDADRDVGNLGVTTRGDTVDSLTRLFSEAGASLIDWFRVRVLTDHLTDMTPPPDVDEIIELEWQVGQRDPYRHVGRLIHAVARRR